MKIVIDINENEYIGIKSMEKDTTSDPWTIHLYDAVKSGIPLEDIKTESYLQGVENTAKEFEYEKNKLLEDIRAEISEEMKGIIRDEYSQRQNDYCDGCEWECKHILEIIDKHDPEKAGKEKK